MKSERSLDEKMTALESLLGYAFKTSQLLKLALTHRSAANENDEHEHNERLEYLGDAVVDLVTSQMLFETLTQATEGELSKLRAVLVSESSLAQKAMTLNLGEALRLGHGERLSGGAHKASLLANAFEAVVAAIYLDGGFSAAEKVLRQLFEADLPHLADRDPDAKTRLQEFCQQHFHALPFYRVINESGPEHDRRYTIQVEVVEQIFGTGCGKSKKIAEQAAAHQALKQLSESKKEC